MNERDKRGDMLNRPRHLARVFDRIPNDYEARPGYPDRVFEMLAQRCHLGPGSEVLEIGAGTGQATLPMLDRGARVTAVEPGVALARRLSERTSGRDIEVIVATFEEAPVPHESFDLVASATAFHWVDPAVGPAKCARSLRDRGWLALWWTIWGDPDRPDPFHDVLVPVLEAKAPHLLDQVATPQAYVRDLAARVGEFERVGAFGPITHDVLRWEVEHDPVALRRLFATFAPWLALSQSLRSELLDDVERIAQDDFGGRVRRPYKTVLYLTERLFAVPSRPL